MTNDQKNVLREDVLGFLQDKVEDLFIDFQNVLQVKSGDIDPMDSLHLQQIEEQLAGVITGILVQQKGEDEVNQHEDERAILQLYAFASNRESELKKRGGMTWNETDLAAARAYEEVRNEIDRLLRRENQ
jgi:hypothetical protein